MKRRIICLLTIGIGLAAASAFAQTEQITMTAPIVQTAPATIDKYTPDTLAIHVSNAANAHPAIDVAILAPDGSRLTFHYPDPSVAAFDTDAEVTTLIGQLNTANLTTTSLWKRVLQRLCTDFPARFAGGCSVP